MFLTYANWEISAKEAQQIANSFGIRNLNSVKKEISNEIKNIASAGKYKMKIYLHSYNVLCLEDWCNIYNWLIELGYKIEDNSANKSNPHFVVKW